MWAYDNLSHRDEQRKKLKAGAEWKLASSWVGDYLVEQESVFLTPTAFSPIS
jgi:hypothetical protein